MNAEDGVDRKDGENKYPPITVLMPVYNSPDLFRSLESVRCQRYRPLQLVLVDDASETFCEDEIRAFFSDCGKELSVCLLRNEENLGTVRTMNRGLAAAEGKYVFNLACDDAFFDEQVLAEWVAAFEGMDCDALTARRANCDGQLEEIVSYSPSDKTIRALASGSSEELYEFFVKDCPISGACTAWRLESLRRLGLYDEGYRLIEDYPAYLKLLRTGGRIGFFDRIVIRYRNGGVSEEGRSVSPDFERDYERLNREEIIPNTRNAAAARRRLSRWLHNIHFDRWYNAKREENSRSRFRLALLRLLYDIYHPVRTIRAIKQWEK